jgi:hypothetical protein
MADVSGYVLGGGTAIIGVRDTEAASLYGPVAMYAAIPSPRTAYFITGPSLAPTLNIRYYQRVLDDGVGGTGLWCYYDTLNALNTSPASGATSPNWTGATPPTSPQVVAAVPVP